MDIVFELESLEIFDNAFKEVLVNLYDSNIVPYISLEPHVIQAAKEEFKKLLSNSYFDITELTKLLNTRGWDQGRVDRFLSLLQERKSEILCAALTHHHSTYGETVTGFNWLLKLVLGTNELKSLKYPILQLILSTVNTNGEQKRRIVDVNREMLSKLINVLESVEEIKII